MNRLQSMLERLPPIYRIERGALTEQLLGLVALALEIFDEDLDRVQRSHWIDDAFDRDDLAKLGALVGVAPEIWEADELFRARLRAMIAARLQGAVTPAVLETVVTRILAAAQRTFGVRYLDILPDEARAATAFRSRRGEWLNRISFEEFPPVRRRSPELVAARGLVRPLDHLILTNRGLEPAALECVLRGVPAGRTAVPLLVNLTNGTCIGLADVVRCGEELRLLAGRDGGLRALLDDVDVSSRVYTSAEFVPGSPFVPVRPDPDPRPIRLERGDNDLWYVSLALFDVPGLDSAMLGLASPELRQGKFGAPGGTLFDQSVFHQEPAVVMDVWWDERAPASFRFEVPAGAVRRRAGASATPEEDRVRLFALLQRTVDVLRAAAVDGRVRPRPFRDEQRMRDAVRVLTPGSRERASAGVDVMAAIGALFDLTSFDRSRIG